jgi:tRNA nucleotidyltransferase (CCA-adding enzyme)
MKIYEVGGAIRDSLLGKIPKDKDWVVVGSSPEEMVNNGFKPIGKDFPVFLHPKTNEEYALARTERKTGHGYHGFNFYFGKEVTLEEDLSRRDLTINAIAKDAKGDLIDPFNGQEDIKNKVFKHVSPAFSEDPLRAIRLARFHTYEHLNDFAIDGETADLLRKIVASGEIASLSANRIWAETQRSLGSSNPNIYFEVLLRFNLHIPHLENLKNFACNSSKDIHVRWCELQANNDFVINSKLPVPNDFINAAETLKKLLSIKINSVDEELIDVLNNVAFERNEELIRELVLLPHLENTNKFILKLLDNIKETDFSSLAEVANEQIKEEKFKLLKEVIKKSQ